MILSEDVEANEFLGYSVKAYCEEKASGMFCLRFISLKPGENEVTEIKISEIDGIEDYNILLMDENGKTKKYPYGKTSPVIYNGISMLSPGLVLMLLIPTMTLFFINSGTFSSFSSSDVFWLKTIFPLIKYKFTGIKLLFTASSTNNSIL